MSGTGLTERMIRSAYDRFVSRGVSSVVPHSSVAQGSGSGRGPGFATTTSVPPSNHPHHHHHHHHHPTSNLSNILVAARGNSPAPLPQRSPAHTSNPPTSSARQLGPGPVRSPGSALAQGSGLVAQGSGLTQGPGLAQGSGLDDLRHPSSIPRSSARLAPSALPSPMSYAASIRSRASQDTFGLADDFLEILCSFHLCTCCCSSYVCTPSTACPVATKICKGHYNLNKKFKLLRTSLFFLLLYLVLWMTLLGYKGTYIYPFVLHTHYPFHAS